MWKYGPPAHPPPHHPSILEVARRNLPRAPRRRFKLRLDLAADRLGLRAARMEGAARRARQRARHVAREDAAPPPPAPPHARGPLQPGPGVGMARPAVQ